MSSEAPFSLTVKIHGDLYTVRGDSWPQFNDNLTSALLEIGRVSEYILAAHAVNALAVDQPAPASPPANTWEPAPQQGPPPVWAQPAQDTTPPAPTCVHGPRKYVTGSGAKGPWKAWMCPTPKGTPGQCAPEWIK